ncbi:MAG TPA: carboxypeptidase-like regulatory domain-containing protein, partial [Phnomibacter sp.]|nr:carboxypeptidase-like regulatory domain-containing protein [Phnomibacter sp.]
MMRICTLLLAICCSLQVWAQKVVTGKVTDENGAPLSDITVTVKGTATATATKADGTYSITVPNEGRVLVFTSVNTEKMELAIGNRADISVSLRSVTTNLDEVVVTGYQTVRKRDVAAAISKISAEEIDNLPIPNFAQAIQGRAAGVAISAANGIPGGNLSVIIRGVGSINAGSTPLYVV